MKLALIGAALALAIPAAAHAQQRTPLPIRVVRAEAAMVKAASPKLARGTSGVRTSRTGAVRTMTRPSKPAAARNERER